MFNNLSVQAKLGVMIVPAALALTALTYGTVQPRLTLRSQARQASADAALAVQAMQVLDELEVERAASTWVAGGTTNAGLSAVATARSQVDARFFGLVSEVRSSAATAGPGGTEVVRATEEFRTIRAGLDAERLSPNDTFVQYTVLTDGLLNYIDSLVSRSPIPELGQLSSSLMATLNTKDQIGRQMAEIAAPGATSDLEHVAAIDILVRQEARDADLFKRRATVELVEQFNTLQSDSAVARGNQALGAARLSRGTGSQTQTAEWFGALAEKLAAYDVVDDATFADYQGSTADKSSSASRGALIYLLVGLSALIIGTLSSLLLGRVLARRVRVISHEAEDIAGRQLPLVLEALRNPNEQQLRDALPQISADSTDEIGLLARSFNTVLSTSVETSFAHSQRRAATVTNMLVNLGRRNQAIIDRQLVVLDRLQASASDPVLLKALFDIDHAATRMRRNAENLVLLAGQQGVRAWTDPVPLSDVMRAAMSETRALERVQVDSSSSDVIVSGAHVVELSHLLAELLENALSYSPPTSPVSMRAERNGLDYRIIIVDTGVGLTSDELSDANDRLMNPPDIDALTTDRVGFHVVGRLARRLGVRVSLHGNSPSGVMCRVDVPSTLLTGPLEQERAPRIEERSPVPAPVAKVGWSAPQPDPVPAPVVSPAGWLAPAPRLDAVGPPLGSEGLVQRTPGASFGRAQTSGVLAGAFKRLPESNDTARSVDPAIERHRHSQMSGYQKAVEFARDADKDKEPS